MNKLLEDDSLIANVRVELALDRDFDYLVPDALREAVALGSQVLVPFGRQLKKGYVVGFADKSDFAQLKKIRDVIGEKPLLTEPVLRLARWMAEYYAAPLEMCIQAIIPSAVRRKNNQFKKLLYVTVLPAAADDDLLARLASESSRQYEVLQILCRNGSMPMGALVREAGTTAVTVRALAEKAFVQIEETVVNRDPFANSTILKTEPLPLMEEQQTSFAQVCASLDAGNGKVVLLHGVTGSGKTEVYLQSLDYALKQGKGGIILVPEISLTPQTVQRFRSRFGDRIAVLHSHLSDGERHDEWHRLYDGKALIAIGARSALFAPVRNLGLIVVDEEHEGSYKQDEAPRYNARDIAVVRGHFENCTVILGSATPSLESYNNARVGKYELSKLTIRADHRSMPLMHIVDMRVEAQREGKIHAISRELKEAIDQRLRGGEQIILFLNRRGFSTSLICTTCGYVAECPDCSIAMTYHKTTHKLICHICGRTQVVPVTCPEEKCAGTEFKKSGFGTQRIEEIVSKIFPGARIARMDSDTTTRKDSYERILGGFRAGKTDILIGTQMIAKGLHFPNVTLVGVINADSSLHMPDFRAGERTFQLLTQVSGRAGRGEIPVR